ncbi:sigma-70 family RNA polymerase sigma factor [Actinacidiphila rubida]|uniref:RNA polymerase, sigma subunit, ECF family n=1 Tax=Actinacidiphila rubida TaxID=310780 RepID=A0A1H8MVY1_9ACTN|nr:sigma-70 family RNA polymerase sigma factor [Actinacidiphila rubida]SEO21434.1 RNA polymerase, sigma subunit, ECF family [Actinacidiphila rubida]
MGQVAAGRRPAPWPALARARAGDGEAFQELTEPYRRELQLHCYRMLGSVQDAEDAVQETLLAAWRGLHGYEGRASVRGWLYRIATNRCLNVLRDAGRRPRPVLPARPPLAAPEPTGRTEPRWYEPYPDDLLAELPDAAPGPEARYEARESLTVAFVAGLQRLPPRQRAVLVLRDVLGFRAAEVAELLDASGVSVNSALLRARASLDGQLPRRDRDRAPLPRSARERALAGRFAAAIEEADVEKLVALLTDDARLTMPPEPLEYRGRAAIAGFYRALPWWGSGALRLRPARANGGPAFGAYLSGLGGGTGHAYGLVVLTLAGDGVGAVTRFGDNALLPRFGLPAELPG